MRNRENAETVQMASGISIHSLLISNVQDGDEEEEEEVDPEKNTLILLILKLITLMLQSENPLWS